MSPDPPRLHARASLTEERIVYKFGTLDITVDAVEPAHSSRATGPGIVDVDSDDLFDAPENFKTDDPISQLCSCDLARFADEERRLALPVKPGDVARTRRPLLSTFKPLIPEDLARAEWLRKNRATTLGKSSRGSFAPSLPFAKAILSRHSATSLNSPSSAVQPATSPSRPASRASAQSYQSGSGDLRPCVVLRADERETDVDVFLMGKFRGTPYTDLPAVLREYFLTVYTTTGDDLRIEGQPDRAHIHTSPCWTTDTTAYLIPLVVHVPRTEFDSYNTTVANKDGEKEEHCTYVNNKSMDCLRQYHRAALARHSRTLNDERERRNVAQALFKQTKIVDLFEEDFRSMHSSPSKADASTSWRSDKPGVRGRLAGLFAPKAASTGAESTTSGGAAATSPLRQTASPVCPPQIVLPDRRSGIDGPSWRRGSPTPLGTTPKPPLSDTHLLPVPDKPASRTRTRTKTSSGKRSPSVASSVRSYISFDKTLQYAKHHVAGEHRGPQPVQRQSSFSGCVRLNCARCFVRGEGTVQKIIYSQM
ncbi:uncharacterized protein SCHCODRAFT_02482074 [Schizophyllum commune H4-8]|uniref:uncharacterized protein n=1 Tax=Schizophyllum commune (strain H4-8 / FGSC 9210) TaxID=578458 RepID=UPI002160BAB6|nr:uncharacterized protein SCHCODRAFT_02482074 [Schizophyllum commune H4-8]KAI5900827.1 hypothetical protein SCHCODRAFT_02482074 [Schizophyllum commune H4-8]